MGSIRELLEQGVQRLTKNGRESTGSARLEAQVLLSSVLDMERSLLYAYPEREVTTEQSQRYLSLIERRVQGEPVAYLTGQKEFYGLDFFVDNRVLIPRPETELLVEAALVAGREMLSRGHFPLIADIGTGSGAIPVTLAIQEPRLPYLYATDISADALAVARLNAERHHVEVASSLSARRPACAAAGTRRYHYRQLALYRERRNKRVSPRCTRLRATSCPLQRPGWPGPARTLL